MIVNKLEQTVRKVTNQKNFLNWLQEESFKMSCVNYSIENELYRIDFLKLDETMYSLSVFEKELQKTVSLHFEEYSLSVFVHSFRKIIFWQKRTFVHYVLKEDNYDNDENVRFVWKAIPEDLINLR